MSVKYLYIDDVKSNEAEGTIAGLQSKDKIEVNHRNPEGNWDEQIKYIREQISNYDGLILDQRLDTGKSISGSQSLYRGASLAQEIRILCKEGSIREMPIMLLSAEGNIKGSFDSTGVDLFDLIISKEEIPDIYPKVRNRLIALAEGYEKLLKLDKKDPRKTVGEILAINNERLDRLDARFVEKVEKISLLQAHLISNFLIKEMLRPDGILINDLCLASRLGLDIKGSKDWDELLAILAPTQYSGIYSGGWIRWWMNDVESFWERFSKDDLRTLRAAERVEILKSTFRLSNLVAAKPLEFAKSDIFWTVCKGEKAPLAITDGLLIDNQDDIFPWQDRQYVSYTAALNRTHSEEWKDVSPLERSKLEKLQILYKRERPDRKS